MGEMPLDSEEYSYYRAQVGRLLFLTDLRPDLQSAIGQLLSRVSRPSVSDRIVLKRCIRFLRRTRDYTLKLFPRGRLTLPVDALATQSPSRSRLMPGRPAHSMKADGLAPNSSRTTMPARRF